MDGVLLSIIVGQNYTGGTLYSALVDRVMDYDLGEPGLSFSHMGSG